MDVRLLTLNLEQETDIIPARRRTRKVCELLGFDTQDQTRITTAVSEIVRNALEYGRSGRVEYRLKENDGAPAPSLEIVVSDAGPGIADVKAVLEGRHRSAGGLGVGITGARRLMDRFAIESDVARGTRVTMAKRLPRSSAPLTWKKAADIADVLTKEGTADPVDEIRQQNKDMLVQLQELQRRHEELERLNVELRDTNRGVVALYAELDERADHLRRADELKSKFLSNMSHEFRTPLNSIISLSRLLLSRTDGMLTGEQEKQIQFVRKAAENLTEMVDDLLDLARVEAGKTVVTPKEFSIEELFGALKGMLRPLLVGNTVDLIFDAAANIPVIFHDEGKASQILRNFISNAIKFTERGEIRVHASFDEDTDSIVFKISDTGIGIPPEDMELIWKEFGQAHNPIQKRVKGTGLGLPLAKKLATLMGGSVAVESVVGKGSAFTFTMPRRYQMSGQDSEAISVTLEPGKIPVLTLEDDAADAFSIERSLAYSRYQPIPARSVAQAKQILEQIAPAAILLDILLEHEESWRFLFELKQNDRTCEIPVAVVSSAQEELKSRSFGADEYLEKPIIPEKLVATLDELTGAHSVKKVLVVDDEEVSRYLIRHLLPRGSFQLREAASAVQGLESLRADRPDVILLDIGMEEGDGFSFLDSIARSDDLADLPAIVVTGMALTEEQRRLLSQARSIVSKQDLSTEALVSAIRDAVG